MSPASIDQARTVKARVAEVARAYAPVVGVGLTRVGESFAVKVNLGAAALTPDALPREVEGVPVVYEVVGKVSRRAAG